METRILGNTGMTVSSICLGTMQFGWSTDEETSFKIMNKAYDVGMMFWDTANVYSRWSPNSYAGKTEEIMGKWFKSTGNRDNIILATKVRGKMGDGPNDEGLSRRHINQQIKASLKRLKTKWVDLYQTHSYDPTVAQFETLSILNDLIRNGMVNSIGASNYPAWALTEAYWIAKENNISPYSTYQPFFSVASREDFEKGAQEVCKRYGIDVIPYSPLAAGFLTGKYTKDGELPKSERAKSVVSRFMNEKGWAVLEVVTKIAEEHGTKPTCVALAWILDQPTIASPIIGANTVEQLEEILLTSEVNLKVEDMKRLTEVSNWK